MSPLATFFRSALALALAGPIWGNDLSTTGTFGEDFVPAPGDLLTASNTSGNGVSITTLHFELADGIVFDPEQTGGVPGELIDETGVSGFDGVWTYGDPLFQPLPEPRTVYGTLTLAFTDFQPGEEVHILLDVDADFGVEAFVSGGQFAGSTLAVTYDNGQATQVVAGTYTAAGSDAAVSVSGMLSLQATETVRVGVPANPSALLPGLTSGPVTGSTWDPRVDHAAFLPGAVLDVLGASGASTNLPLPPLGTLLCQIGTLVFTASPGVPFAVPIPDSCALVGLSLCTQAASVDAAGTIALTNALDITVGTF
ncbi:MAG: hypothetical protein AAF682_09750 [Planctomycetota bacterium]